MNITMNEFRTIEFNKGDVFVLRFQWSGERVSVNVPAKKMDESSQTMVTIVEEIDAWDCWPGTTYEDIKVDCANYFSMYLENQDSHYLHTA